MAASITTQRSIDLKTNGTHTVRLGNSIQRSTTSDFSAVRYNHRPDFRDPEDVSLSIVQKEQGDGVRLSLKDGEEEYEFQGQSQGKNHTFILLPAEDGDGFVLEKLGVSHNLNITSTPWETDRQKLEQQYGFLTIDNDGQDGSEGEDDLEDEQKPDMDNPFDFRHYIQSSLAMLSPAVRPERVRAESALQGSPTISRTSTPVTRPARTSNSAFPATNRKPKAKVAAPPREVSPPNERSVRQDVPSVRLERRGTTQLPRKPVRKPSVEEIQLDNLDDDDDDGIVLEGVDRTSQSQRSLGRALVGTLGEGPISLRSAASSPGGRVDSPAPSHTQRRSGLGRNIEENDIIMDDDDDGNDGSASRQRDRHHRDQTANDNQDEDDDGDVEDLELPSPVQDHRASLSGTAALADDEDDLEKQMLMAMEADDDEPAPAQEEEEESEEE